jgi:predicted Zn-dependent peptidase
MRYRALKSLAIIVALCALATAQDVASFEKRITVKKLDNGLTVIICERPEAPVFSFNTHVDAGSVQDPMGQTGMAHMFEHMAFKGTDTIGTTDYAAEKVALGKVETAYSAYIQERDKPFGRSDDKLKELQKPGRTRSRQRRNTSSPTSFPRFLRAMELRG